MIDQVFGETTSFFSGTILLALRVLFWIAITILRIAFPFVLFGVVLVSKGALLFAALLLVTFWTYWSKLGVLYARLRSAQGVKKVFGELQSFGFASLEELRFQDVPFSVVTAVQDTPFYRRFISFVDMQSTDQITIQNFMSLGWIAQVLDSGLTRVVKLAMPIAIHVSNLLVMPIYLMANLLT